MASKIEIVLLEEKMGFPLPPQGDCRLLAMCFVVHPGPANDLPLLLEESLKQRSQCQKCLQSSQSLAVVTEETLS